MWGGHNIYRYAKNNPLSRRDPLGLLDCPPSDISALIRGHMDFFKGLGKYLDKEQDGYLSGKTPFPGSDKDNDRFNSIHDDFFTFDGDPRGYVDGDGKYPIDAGYHTHPPQGPALGPDTHPSRDDLKPDPGQKWPEIIIPINPDGTLGDEFPVLFPRPGGWDVYRYHSGCK